MHEDRKMRLVASALVSGAPEPPTLPTHPSRKRGKRIAGRSAIAGVSVFALLLVAAVSWPSATTVWTRVSPQGAAPMDDPDHCVGSPPVLVSPGGASGENVDGPAPGEPAPEPGQRVWHWPRPEGAVEVRWPARPQATYDPDSSRVSTLTAAQMIRPGRAEVDVDPEGELGPEHSYDIDIVAEGGPAPADRTANCGTVQVAVITPVGRWVSGLGAPMAGGPPEFVDLQPLVAEHLEMQEPPQEVVGCEGAWDPAIPATRRTGPRADLSGDRPADALRAYIRSTPGAQRSGYIEMAGSDGSVTFATRSPRGWTALVRVSRERVWFVQETFTSGC
jgi:hypothetical protein